MSTPRGARAGAREVALHVLFALDARSKLGSDDDPSAVDDALARYWDARAEGLDEAVLIDDPESRAYAEELIRGVAQHLSRVDEALGSASRNWRIERMTRVDRTLLRIGTYELIEPGGAPRAVVIDQAIELAKAYGTDDSSAFINGVLNQVAEAHGRA